MEYIILDVEMNSCSHNQEIIEIGAVRLNGQLEYINCFLLFVKPRIYSKLTKRIKEKTTIRQDWVDNGYDLVDALERFKMWLGEREYLLCGWGLTEYEVFQKNYQLYNIDNNLFVINDYCNIQEQFRLIYNLKTDISLDNALIMLDINKNELDQSHRAIIDAKYTSIIFTKIFEKINIMVICNKCKRTHKFNELCKLTSGNLVSRNIFDFNLEKTYKINLNFNEIDYTLKQHFDKVIPYITLNRIYTGREIIILLRAIIKKRNIVKYASSDSHLLKMFIVYAKLSVFKKNPFLIGYIDKKCIDDMNVKNYIE